MKANKIFILFGVIVFSINIHAGTGYKTIWAVLQSYPRNAGVVSIRPFDGEFTELCDDPNYYYRLDSYVQKIYYTTGIEADGQSAWKDSVSVAMACLSMFYTEYAPMILGNNTQPEEYRCPNGAIYSCCAIPNDGYQFIGFSRSTYLLSGGWPYYWADKNRTYHMYDSEYFEFNTNVIQTDNPGMLYVLEDQTGAWIDFSPTKWEDWYYPYAPNEYSWALFTRVAVGKSEGGKAKIDNNVNEIGDVVTISATPDNEDCSFAYWIEESTGRRITENPFTFEVTGMETYTPHFEPSANAIETLGISKPQTTFTIGGQRLNKEPKKGIYIIDNKKVMR